MGAPWGLSTSRLLGVEVQQRHLIMFVTTMVLVAILFAFFRYSRMGLAMRAVAFDQEVALAQGVSVGFVFALSWAIAGALATVAGVFVSTGAGVDQQLWIIALKALPVIILGGLDSLGGAVIAALLCMGFQPLMEIIFNLATPSKLLELANPNQPLLRRLLIEAPGTYHHSIIVANLSEAAAEAIGANPLLARVGSYFHDVGKLKRPLYFKENQLGDNPHDHTDPYVSSAIVTAHARDGLQMAKKYRLPMEIEKIIMEHHGDTPVMFFYHKALQQADGNPVDIQDFRYDGTRPSMKESAIVMLADTIEAAVRSMPDPTPQRIEEFIEQLVRGKLEDGQLSDSPLTLRDIDKICDAFTTVLIGGFLRFLFLNFHRRVFDAFMEHTYEHCCKCITNLVYIPERER
jgi:putative nucleotidyltransferase with HDIG domain